MPLALTALVFPVRKTRYHNGMAAARERAIGMAIGAGGFLAGLGLWFISGDSALQHLGLILAIAAPVIAFYRILKPRIGHRQCPRPPEWTAR